jgi:integrase
MKRAQRHAVGSVRFDKRRKTWNYLWYENGKRRSKLIGTKQEYPTKALAWKVAERFSRPSTTRDGETVRELVARYRSERMPPPHSTSRVYGSFLDNHIIPKWGGTLVREVQPRPVELWLRQLPLSLKSKTHVRSLMHGLLDFAMWAGIIAIARNPISLVVNKGATKRTRKARSLTVDRHALLSQLREPFATMALLCVCLGLRISEALALRWSDIDWLGSRLVIRRGIVEQVVDDVKTEGSAKMLVLANDLLTRLQLWKRTEFSRPDDWVFASPVKIGRLPYSYTGVWRELDRAAMEAGIGHPGNTRLSAHVPQLARCSGHAARSPAEDDAPFRHQDDDEHLWRSGHR